MAKTKAKATKPATGINKPVIVSDELKEIVGKKPLGRGACIKALWAYIKKNDLNTGKTIHLTDEKLNNCLLKYFDDSNTVLSDRVKKKIDAAAMPEEKRDKKKKSKFKNQKVYKEFLATCKKNKSIDMMKMNALLADHMMSDKE